MNRKIAIAGTGYVGLSLAVLLAQKNQVTAVDIIPEKVEKINNKKSPIQDDYIEKYLAEKELNLVATTDGASAYKDAEFVIIAAPTNYDSKRASKYFYYMFFKYITSCGDKTGSNWIFDIQCSWNVDCNYNNVFLG